MDDLEIVDTDETNHDALAAYYADGSNKDHDKPPVANSHARTHASRGILAGHAHAPVRARARTHTHTIQHRTPHARESGQVLNPYLGLAVEQLNGMALRPNVCMGLCMSMIPHVPAFVFMLVKRAEREEPFMRAR